MIWGNNWVVSFKINIYWYATYQSTSRYLPKVMAWIWSLPQAHVLKAWSSAGDTTHGGIGNFGRWGQVGGNRHGLGVFILPWPLLISLCFLATKKAGRGCVAKYLPAMMNWNHEQWYVFSPLSCLCAVFCRNTLSLWLWAGFHPLLFRKSYSLCGFKWENSCRVLTTKFGITIW
jgi:hypothetical protein